MKKVLVVIFMFIFLFTGVSCGNQDLNYIQKEAEEQYKLSYEERLEEGYVNFKNKLDSFYAKFSEETYKYFGSNNTNLCVSPVSVYMALALTIECSSGETRNEILEAIGVTYDEVRTYTKRLFSECNKEYKEENMLGNEKIKALELLTNSIWFNEGLELEEVGLTNLAKDYNCSSFSAPFETKNKQANKALRDFVSRNTKGLIDRDFQLGVDTLIALVNTLYLKEIWNDDGDDLPFTNNSYTFTNYDLSTKELALLRGYYNTGRVVTEEKFSHFYTTTNHGFRIKFIVPNQNYTIDDIYTEEVLSYVNNVTDYKAVNDEEKTIASTRVFFPEFKGSFNEDIIPVIQKGFGIKSLFNYKTCDFTGIINPEQYLDKYEGIYCSKIIHQTELIVDKTGIEGAAVTIVAMDGAESAGPDEYEYVYFDYIIDQAFAYIITDYSGIVLFTGVVKNV
ncbi:MAG: hypothetical protein IJX78_06255 [Bacilli bacterium]|nr:hypothetical protein [Bacilli bacterium]